MALIGTIASLGVGAAAGSELVKTGGMPEGRGRPLSSVGYSSTGVHIDWGRRPSLEELEVLGIEGPAQSRLFSVDVTDGYHPLSPSIDEAEEAVYDSEDEVETPNNSISPEKDASRETPSPSSSLQSMSPLPSPIPEKRVVVCDCESHHGKQLAEYVVGRTPEQLKGLIFDTTPWFRTLYDALAKTKHSIIADDISDYKASEWTNRDDGAQERTISYTLALHHPLAPKNCIVNEKQVLKHLDREEDGFVVTTETNNSGIPFADSFFVKCSYCVTSVGRTQCRLLAHGGIVFRKTIWGIMKSPIEKSTAHGLADHSTAMRDALTAEFPPIEEDPPMALEAATDEPLNDDDCPEPMRETTMSEPAPPSCPSPISSSSPSSEDHSDSYSVETEECQVIDIPYLGIHSRSETYQLAIISLLCLVVILILFDWLTRPSPLQIDQVQRIIDSALNRCGNLSKNELSLL